MTDRIAGAWGRAQVLWGRMAPGQRRGAMIGGVLVAALAAGMLVCIFPANAKAAREHLTIGGKPVPGLAMRAGIQVVFLGALAASVWPGR